MQEVASRVGHGDGEEGVEEVAFEAAAAGNAVEVVAEVVVVQVAGSVAVVSAFASAVLRARKVGEGSLACVDTFEILWMMLGEKKRSMAR